MKYTKSLLIIAFLAFSISCTNAANDSQTNTVSQNTVISETSSSSADNEALTQQNAAPDAAVKELYKLHDANKSPLYKAKDRAAMERYFSKDFVNLVWTGGKEPNLMNKLAIEGDALTGLDSTSKVESHSVGKPQINGNKATVPVTVSASDEDNKKFKNSLNYELIKEDAGWRIADIKGDGFSLVGTVKSLIKTSEESSKELDKEFEYVKPPFVGTRWFVINHGVEGSGTPRYYLKINENNYMFCGFVQTNQSNGTDSKEEVPLGRFKKIFDCSFKNEIGGNFKFKVEGNYIYELDKNSQVIESEVCCRKGDSSKECECKGEFIK